MPNQNPLEGWQSAYIFCSMVDFLRKWGGHYQKKLKEHILLHHTRRVNAMQHFIILPSAHSGWDKMAAIMQMMIPNAFSWTKMFELQLHWLHWLQFYWISSLGSNWQFVSIGWDDGLAPNRWQAIIWTNDSLFHWCIHMHHSASMSW